MSTPAHEREPSRSDRLPRGVWRLRLPTPLTGISHSNAWAIADDDGIVLVDCGVHAPGSMANLDLALGDVGLRLEDVRLLICTHAHVDHYGQVASVVGRAGCELWMHPSHGHLIAELRDRDATLAKRIEIGRASGLPEPALREIAAIAATVGSTVAGIVEPHRDLVDGTEFASDLGSWLAVETPGHAPSHVALWQPDHRILISGDLLMHRVALSYDFGYTPDPVGEFLTSLDVVDGLGAHVCLPGHGRAFGDVTAHVAEHRGAVHERLESVVAVLRRAPLTAYEAVAGIHGEIPAPEAAVWWVDETRCYLRHQEIGGRVRPVTGDGGEVRWALS